ncbi:uncharacterized protein LOC128393798 [Panonychus citri]|uniref:uncharacterized protein LOC128393798 n=1 Tax=Panonychus citri TaxID=50023 RepID=UPI002307F6F8|nr:uncharacterized protein LOC128393798 [Panonychus citri]
MVSTINGLTIKSTVVILLLISQIFLNCEGASMLRSLNKRDAYSSLNSVRTNKLGSGEPCEDNGVTIKRICTYEECLKNRYPNIDICRRWDEIEWSEKVEVCHKLVNTPCNEY